MVYTEEQIFEIILNNLAVPSWVVEARKTNTELVALINGDGFKSLILQIQHKEDSAKATARRKYSRSIKDMFERLLRPLDNIYSATGGTKQYNGNTKLIESIVNIKDGKTLEKWLQVNWMRLYHTDPNGIILNEWTKEKTYPTYKSIQTIRCYESDGQKMNWILFEPIIKDGVNYYRFIDGAKDYMIKEVNKYCEVIVDQTYVNPFGIVPGFINSDIIKIGTEIRKSPIDSIIEIAKEYLSDQSIKSIFKFLHGMPIFWRYAVKCPSCQGLGKTGDKKCSDCDGQGYLVKKDITDCVTLPVPEEGQGQKLAPDIAGYVVPPLDIWKQYNDEEKLLYMIMYETIWGVQDKSQVTKTATEIFMDTQPMISKLNVYADVAEWCEWWLTELIAKYVNPNKSEKEKIVILYGRNYILEAPETLLKKYQLSKEKGDNTAILDQGLMEWMYARFKSDPQRLNDELTRLYVEPFIHYTVEQVNSIYGSKEAKEKMLFSKWWNMTDKRSKTKDVLYKEFEEYCDEEIEEEEVTVEEGKL